MDKHDTLNSVLTPKIYIVILNWNGINDTLGCIDSIQTLVYKNYELIVVDNGSEDNSSKIIRERYPNIIVIENESNLGYADGNNVGIEYALQHNADYVWLLNNDTFVDRNALTALVEIGEKNSEVGILGSKIFYYDRPNYIWFAGAMINWKRAESNHIGQNEVDRKQYDFIREIDRVTGCSMLVKRCVCERIGLLDGKLFLYTEEVDWCGRAKKNGYKIYYVPDSKVYHKISSSTGLNFERIFYYYNTRNFLYVIYKNLSFPIREIYLIRAILTKIYECKSVLREIFKLNLWPKEINYSKEMCVMRGILDFVLGRMGKGYYEDIL